MEELKQKLLDLVNNSDLPFEAVYYVIKDLYRDADESYRAFIEQRNNNKDEDIDTVE